MMNRKCRRSVALLLCAAMLLSAAAGMAETAVSVFTGTDRHTKYETVSAGEEEVTAPNGKTLKMAKQLPVYDADGSLIWHNNLTGILSLVAQDEDAVQPEVILLGGDMIGDGGDKSSDETGYPKGAPPYSVLSLDAQIAHVFGGSAAGLYTYGSHDNGETGDYGEGFFSGPVKGHGYWIYGVSFAQMAYDSDLQAKAEDSRGKTYSGKDTADRNGISAQTASRRFLSWAKSLDDHWPVIVMSHIPLHAIRGDNSGAWTWTRALNEAAEDRDILFLWGHNHTVQAQGGEEEATELANYLLLPGEEITVQSWDTDGEGKTVTKREIPSDTEEEDGETQYELITEKETLKFTYMNAGYIINGTGTLLTFTDREDDGVWDSLEVKRYRLEDAAGDPLESVFELPLRTWAPAAVPAV